MYRVFIVDDEPSFLHQIKVLIERIAPCFEVIGTAYNGMDALSAIKSTNVDVLITDVYMPGMNGTRLIEEVRKEKPELICLIVSGYADFEYAKSGLKAGAQDYILKPIAVSDFRQTMEKVRHELDMRYAQKRIDLIEAIIRNDIDFLQENESIVKASRYRAVVILDGWYYSDIVSEVYLDDDYQLPVSLADLRMIGCALYPNLHMLLLPDPPENIIETTGLELSTMNNCKTIVFSDVATTLSEIAKDIRTVFRAVEYYALTSMSRVEESRKPISDAYGISPDTEHKLLQLAEIGNCEDFIAALQDAGVMWKSKKTSQKSVIDLMIATLRILRQRFASSYLYDPVQEFETLRPMLDDLEDIVSTIRIYAEDGFLAQKVNNHSDGEIYRSIETYINGNLNNDVSLSGACEVLHISQPVISRIVRMMTSMSFTEYVTYLKMNKAKRLFDTEPDISVYEVANLCGYKDPAYFSRVFRTKTGRSPKQYKQNK